MYKNFLMMVKDTINIHYNRIEIDQYLIVVDSFTIIHYSHISDTRSRQDTKCVVLSSKYCKVIM